jgi:glucose-1-phosphate cytidylyltransferase
LKVVILAGGLGTRISEESYLKPKPMVEIGEHPILWHIMKSYAHHGLTEFIICLGYKGYVIKEYFANYVLHHSDVTINLPDNEVILHQKSVEPWRVTLVDTGNNTETGGRIKRIRHHLQGEKEFCLTYGDGVSDIDMKALLAFHRGHGLNATVTAVQPPGRFGALNIADDRVTSFSEKPQGDGGFINGGFFVLSTAVLDLIDGEKTVWERGPMETLANSNQLAAYKHRGFWHPMDTMRDKNYLNTLWAAGNAPWQVWQ